MPWRQVPTKDVGHCDKPREAVYKRRSEDFRMGKPARAHLEQPLTEYIGLRQGTQGTETSKYLVEKRSFP
jgi:hypothetical protein